LREDCANEGGTGDVDCFDGTGDGMRAFVGVLEGGWVVGLVGILLGGDGGEGRDARGFGVDGIEVGGRHEFRDEIAFAIMTAICSTRVCVDSDCEVVGAENVDGLECLSKRQLSAGW
jgi:hypothetical protein